MVCTRDVQVPQSLPTVVQGLSEHLTWQRPHFSKDAGGEALRHLPPLDMGVAVLEELQWGGSASPSSTTLSCPSVVAAVLFHGLP